MITQKMDYGQKKKTKNSSLSSYRERKELDSSRLTSVMETKTLADDRSQQTLKTMRTGYSGTTTNRTKMSSNDPSKVTRREFKNAKDDIRRFFENLTQVAEGKRSKSGDAVKTKRQNSTGKIPF